MSALPSTNDSDSHRLLRLILEKHAKSEWQRIAEAGKYSTMDLLKQDVVNEMIQAFENEVKRLEPMLKHELRTEVQAQLSTFLQEGGTFMQRYESYVQSIRSNEVRESARRLMTQTVQDVSTRVWPDEAKALGESPAAVEEARDSFYARARRTFDEDMELAELQRKHSVQYEEALQDVMDHVLYNKFAQFVQELRT